MSSRRSLAWNNSRMMIVGPRRLQFMTLLLTASCLVGLALADGSSPPSPSPFAGTYAIRGGKVVASSGKVFDPGTVVVRRGVISAVGPASSVVIPAEAETIDGNGLIVYPGFLDLYSTNGQRSEIDRSSVGRGRPVDLSEAPLVWTPPDNRRGLTPEFQVASALEISESVADPRRKQGFTSMLSAPAGAIATGQSALASLGGLNRREAVLRSPIALHLNVKTPVESGSSSPVGNSPGQPGGRRRGGDPTVNENLYPRSLMGAVTHLRQAMLDAQYFDDRKNDFHQNGGTPPPFDPALTALKSIQGENGLPAWWEANTRDEIHRALDLAKEFRTSAVIVGGKEASRVIERLKAEKVPVILRLDFPDEPKVPTEEEYRKKPLTERDEPLSVLKERHRKWKEWVGTAATLSKAGIPFAFATEGLERPDLFAAKLRAVIAAGLKPEDALTALTAGAAKIVGTSDILGTLEAGKLGHVVAFTAPLGEEKAKVRFILLDGQKFEIKPTDQPATGEGRGRRGSGAEPKDRSSTPKPRESVSIKSATTRSATDTEVAKDTKRTSHSESDALSQHASQQVVEQKAQPLAEEKSAKPAQEAKTKADSSATAQKPLQPSFVEAAAEFDDTRKPKLQTGGNVLIKDATILTVTKGTIPKGSILIIDGKIVAVGPDVTVPADKSKVVSVIDAAGLVAMPGIIDTHSHIAIQGSVNEFSLSVVPEIRVKDAVTGDDVSIYRALAGGTTTARLLHGSANTIGGQDAVIKLRYGQPGRDLIMHDGPQGVKFALGENVTRSRGRFPNTRMGVQSVIERAFLEAKAYQEQEKAYRLAIAKEGAKTTVRRPRRDLRLEALSRVLDGSIKIHSHCYRADEILMLLGTAEKYGVKVQSLQHVLEGYKVAAEIAAHGASASTFSDWWGYKVEAFDAIPQNAALLNQAGANVCIKSDSEELIRHLNLEAAKMVKYGDVSETSALAMITINPARELGLDHKIGSIEPGKDGDIVLFNGHPLDGFSRCELSLIEGEVFFQRPEPSGKPVTRPGRPYSMPTAPALAREWKFDLPSQPKGIFALVGANLHPVSGSEIKGGTLVIVDGKIAAIGGANTSIPPEAQTIEMKGLDIWPGIVDSGSDTALSEVGSLSETQDFADAAQIQPELRTSLALKADSVHIPVTRSNGILTAYIKPTGGVIAGQGCAVNLRGWTPREMVIADPVALQVIIPAQLPLRDEFDRNAQGAGERAEARKRRQEQLDRIKEEFRLALRYDNARSSALDHGTAPSTVDPRLEALIPYAKGVKPVIFRASRRIEILDALKIAKELKLKAILSDAWDAWKVTEEIRDAKVPVLLAGTLYVPPEEYDPYDSPYSSPARLHAAGITFAIHSNWRGAGEATASRNLPFEAAMAVAFGLPEEEAIKAITLTPARVLGIDDQVGSLDVGKRANIVVTAGHLLQPTTPVVALFIDGKPLRPESRQTELHDLYKARLKELRARAPVLTTPLRGRENISGRIIGGTEN